MDEILHQLIGCLTHYYKVSTIQGGAWLNFSTHSKPQHVFMNGCFMMFHDLIRFLLHSRCSSGWDEALIKLLQKNSSLLNVWISEEEVDDLSLGSILWFLCDHYVTISIPWSIHDTMIIPCYTNPWEMPRVIILDQGSSWFWQVSTHSQCAAARWMKVSFPTRRALCWARSTLLGSALTMVEFFVKARQQQYPGISRVSGKWKCILFEQI